MLWLRACAQRLTASSQTRTSPQRVLRQLCGLQAQLLPAAGLGIRARSAGLREQDVSSALNEQRSIVRTWLMRGTLHLIDVDDLGWLLGLLGPIFGAGNPARHRELGLDADLKRRGVVAIRRILAGEAPLTRYEIVERLSKHGIRLDPKTQAPIHLIQVAAYQQVLCLGPDRDKGEPTYMSIADWVGRLRTLPIESATGELARRYFAAYGPATVADFVSWSGLRVGAARSAVAAARRGLQEVMVAGRSAFLPKGRLAARLRGRSTAPAVRLLPAFDTYLLGYQARDLAVAPSLRRRLQRGGGWLHPAIVADGRAIGAWSLHRAGNKATVAIELHERLDRATRSGIDREVQDIGRFLGLEISAQIGEPAMRSAPQRSLTQ